MPTVTVTGTLHNPVGNTPLASATVTFNLLARFGTASAGYPAKSVSVVTDADGKLNGNTGIELAVPETGAAYYEVVLPAGPGSSREHFYCYLTAGDDPTSLQALMSDAGSPAEVDTVQAAINAALLAYLPLAGGTLTGALVLAGAPTLALHAATKAYVDANAGGAVAFVDLTDGPGELGGGNQYLRMNNAGDGMEWEAPDWLDLATGDARYARLAGATMTGPLTLPGNPTVALHAAPKQYVDAALAAALTQGEADALYLPLAGGTLSGALGIRASASGVASGLHIPWQNGDAFATLVVGTNHSSNNQYAIYGQTYGGVGVAGRAWGGGQAVRGDAGAGQGGYFYGETTGVEGRSTSGAGVLAQSIGGAGVALDALLTNAPSSSAVNLVALWRANHAATPGAGFGAALVGLLKSSTTADQNATRISSLWNVATHASRAADLLLEAADHGGWREILRGRASGSAPAIGFLGATPATRQTLPAAAADAATTQALVNEIRALLILIGLAQ